MSDTKQNAARLSMFASGLIVAGKLEVAVLTGSLGVLSEALHSLIDFGATVMTWFAVRWADLPADEDHHYGHAKIESVAALLEAVLLCLTAVFVAYQAIRRLLAEPTLANRLAANGRAEVRRFSWQALQLSVWIGARCLDRWIETS